jgi:type III pantothenate kinase
LENLPRATVLHLFHLIRHTGVMSDQFTLAIDIGNTRAKLGVFECAKPGTTAKLPACIASMAVPIELRLEWGKIAAHFGQWNAKVAKAVVAGAYPAGVEKIVSGWPKGTWPVPVAVERAADLPLRVNVEHPDKVGIDRLLDAVAANVLRAPADPAIVVDAGTATTVNLVTAEGVFEGGAILPGIELGARALHQFTALLPLIDVQSLVLNPVMPLGRNTPGAIGSGLWYGHIGAVRELVKRLSESAHQPPLLLVTGGNGRWLAPALGPGARFEPDLALRGLAFAATTN